MNAVLLDHDQTDIEPAGAYLPPAASKARALLQRLAHTWGHRASVK
jgi:hypothetical protein